MSKQFVAYGPGFSGDYDTLTEAQSVVRANGSGAIYTKVDLKAFECPECAYGWTRNARGLMPDDDIRCPNCLYGDESRHFEIVTPKPGHRHSDGFRRMRPEQP